VPDDIVRKLNRAVTQVLELPDVRQRLDPGRPSSASR